MQQRFELNTILDFKDLSSHPQSRIVGIDHYDFDAQDGKKRYWQSYTLIPTHERDRKGHYSRWYVVDLAEVGLSFVTAINKNDMPDNMVIEPKLTGRAIMRTEGDGELGTGKSDLISYWDHAVTPPVMYAAETFSDGSTLYFKTLPLEGLKP